MTIDKKKYENTILYFAMHLDGKIRGKKKLAKLLYFADFDNFEKNEKAITKDEYKALPMGPIPTSMDKVVEAMAKNQILRITEEENKPGYFPTTVYEAVKEPDISVFSKEEIVTLDRVIRKYGHLTGNELGDLTHQQAPYIGTEPNGVVDYELAFYRETDFTGDD